MPASLKQQPQARIREHGHWVSSIDRALAHYGVALAQSSLAYNLTSSTRPVSPFIEQANCNLIWNEATRLADDDLFGLRLHRLFTPTVFNMLGLSASASGTVASALDQLTRFFPVISTQVRLELDRTVSEPSLTLVPLGNPHPQQLEAVLGYICRLLGQLEHANTGLVRRVIAGRPVKEAEVYRRLLGCEEVDFGEQYQVVLPQALLDRPLATADTFIATRLADTLQDMIANLPSHDLVEQVKRRVQLLLGSGDISVERIACPMNISPRHLRRKLSQEGTSYEQLVDEVRRETAMRMIGEGQLSLTSIAYELGFLDPSSFTRAFRRWTDMSPTRFRQQVADQ
ncbi:AraC family transcriptional regulator [Pseudomonas sp. FME51]|uniref:AraC family transcriptional regulator n=1 Tax=Pseudomonas sp. FME51 TaxID=2742609 RepID=UPI0018696192|nr:AraC family transcriptional regulator [Pseudomonas sp. FME51]